MLKLLKISAAVLFFTSLTQFSAYAQSVSTGNEAVDKERLRRENLTKKWREQKLTRTEFFNRIYSPAVQGCKKDIKTYKKLVAKLKSRMANAKTKKTRDKYKKGIELYTEYIKLMESVVIAVQEEQNYSKLGSDIFPKMKEHEKRIAKVTGSKVKRDWLMTSELYPKVGGKKKGESDGKEEGKSSKKKSKK